MIGSGLAHNKNDINSVSVNTSDDLAPTNYIASEAFVNVRIGFTVVGHSVRIVFSTPTFGTKTARNILAFGPSNAHLFSA